MKFLVSAAAVVCAESWIAYTPVSSQNTVSLKKAIWRKRKKTHFGWNKVNGYKVQPKYTHSTVFWLLQTVQHPAWYFGPDLTFRADVAHRRHPVLRPPGVPMGHFGGDLTSQSRDWCKTPSLPLMQTDCFGQLCKNGEQFSVLVLAATVYTICSRLGHHDGLRNSVTVHCNSQTSVCNFASLAALW